MTTLALSETTKAAALNDRQRSKTPSQSLVTTPEGRHEPSSRQEARKSPHLDRRLT
jgi:hypothetical protein